MKHRYIQRLLAYFAAALICLNLTAVALPTPACAASQSDSASRIDSPEEPSGDRTRNNRRDDGRHWPLLLDGEYLVRIKRSDIQELSDGGWELRADFEFEIYSAMIAGDTVAGMRVGDWLGPYRIESMEGEYDDWYIYLNGEDIQIQTFDAGETWEFVQVDDLLLCGYTAPFPVPADAEIKRYQWDEAAQEEYTVAFASPLELFDAGENDIYVYLTFVDDRIVSVIREGEYE